MTTFWRFIVNILHIFSICFPIGLGIHNDWDFTKINEVILALFIILFIFGTVGLCLRIGHCAGCDDEDCPLSLYCELQTKVKRVKRLFVFFGYDKETLNKVINNSVTINYKDNNYIDIIKIIHEKLSESETNYNGYND